MKKHIKKIINLFGYSIVNSDQLSALRAIDRSDGINKIFKPGRPNVLLDDMYIALANSAAQFGQDIFVLNELGFKKNGYFVEFGATNGVVFSNSLMLEREFGWRGILAEPARIWHEDLVRNRNCFIEKNCVYSETGKELEFLEQSGMSGLAAFGRNDMHSKYRERHSVKYSVSTISLNDLLDKYEAPTQIDYLSIDTEGSEFKILSSFDFSKYKISIITVEHNYNEKMRASIRSLLSQYGYINKYSNLSKYDDWYVLDDSINT